MSASPIHKHLVSQTPIPKDSKPGEDEGRRLNGALPSPISDGSQIKLNLKKPSSKTTRNNITPQTRAQDAPTTRSYQLPQRFDIKSIMNALNTNIEVLDSIRELSLSSSSIPSIPSTPYLQNDFAISENRSNNQVAASSHSRNVSMASTPKSIPASPPQPKHIPRMPAPTTPRSSSKSSTRHKSSATYRQTKSTRLPVPSTLFYGDSAQCPLNWIQYYEQFAESHGWSDKDKLDRIMLCLRKRALKWFSDQEVLEKGWSWSKFKREFVHNAGDEDSNIPNVTNILDALDKMGLRPNLSTSIGSQQELDRHQDTLNRLFSLGKIGVELAALLWVPVFAPIIDSRAWIEMMLPHLASDTKIWLKCIKKEYIKRNRLGSISPVTDVSGGGSSSSNINNNNTVSQIGTDAITDEQQMMMKTMMFDISGVPIIDSLSILDNDKFMAKHLKASATGSENSSKGGIPNCQDYHWLINDWEDQQNQYGPYFYIHDEILQRDEDQNKLRRAEQQ